MIDTHALFDAYAFCVWYAAVFGAGIGWLTWRHTKGHGRYR